MSTEVLNIFLPALGGLLFILLSIIAWFAVQMAKRWEESHKHHYSNNNELRQYMIKHVTNHHGRLNTVEKKMDEHDDLFDDMEQDLNDLKNKL